MAKNRNDCFNKMKIKVMESIGSFVILDTVVKWMRVLQPNSEVK
jgi:hypothetical protein